MKKTIVCLVLVFCFWTLMGCGIQYDLNLHQSADNIKMVQLCERDGEEYMTLYTAKGDLLEKIVPELCLLKTYRHNQPWGGYGPYVIKVTYEDGAVELLGVYARGYTPAGSPDSELEFDGWYHISIDDMLDFFSAYLGYELTET